MSDPATAASAAAASSVTPQANTGKRPGPPLYLREARWLGPLVALVGVVTGLLLHHYQRFGGVSGPLDAYADKVLAAALALAVYLSTTLMRIKERRGDYRREMMKEQHKPEMRPFVEWAYRKMGDRTNDSRWLVLPDSALTTLTVVLIVRLVIRGSTAAALSGTRAKVLAAADGATVALILASTLLLVGFHAMQWRTLKDEGASLPDPPPVPAPTPPPTIASSLKGLQVDAAETEKGFRVAFTSTDP